MVNGVLLSISEPDLPFSLHLTHTFVERERPRRGVALFCVRRRIPTNFGMTRSIEEDLLMDEEPQRETNGEGSHKC